jgi:hypothetical protein
VKPRNAAVEDDPGWHSHIGAPDELTITIEPPAST